MRLWFGASRLVPVAVVDSARLLRVAGGDLRVALHKMQSVGVMTQLLRWAPYCFCGMDCVVMMADRFAIACQVNVETLDRFST